MNDREFDTRVVEVELKIDRMFEDFLREKLGNRGQEAAPAQEEFYGEAGEQVLQQASGKRR